MKRLLSFALACAGLILASACDFGSDVSGVDVPELVPLALAPSFAIAPTAEELAALDLLVVKLLSVPGGDPVQRVELDSLWSRDEWSVDIRIPVSEPPVDSFFVSAELLAQDGSSESVEWSGATDPFLLQSTVDRPVELRLVLLYRGPLANLGLDSLSLSQGSIRLVQGATSTIEWTAEGDTTGTVVYFASADTGVAAVDASGVVSATGLGTTEIVVTAGPVGDSLAVEVAAPVLPPRIEVDELIDPALEYVTSDLFISSFQDPVGRDAVRSRFLELRTLLQSGDAVGVVAAFEAAKDTWMGYGVGTPFRELDEPQLGVLELTLLQVATGLNTAFP